MLSTLLSMVVDVRDCSAWFVLVNAQTACQHVLVYLKPTFNRAVRSFVTELKCKVHESNFMHVFI